MTTPSPDHELAAWAAGLDHADIAPEIADLVTTIMLDAVAGALAGARAEEQPAFAAIAARLAGPGRSTVIAGQPLASIGAVFLNAFQVTGATACDVHRPTMTHVTPEVVPVALAAAEREDVDGRTLVAALAAGFEITLRVARALDDEAYRGRAWHNPGVAGPFGAAAAAGRLLALPAPGILTALGHAGGQAAGTFAALGTAGVKVHQARGAVSGLLAATLAAEGIDASPRPLTDPRGGLLAAYADGGRPDELLDGLGTTWRIRELSLRRWPGSSSVQALIEAAFAARGRIAGRPIERVAITMSERSYELGGESPWHDQLAALQSPRFIAASILANGTWGLEAVGPARLVDPNAGAFARERVSVHAAPDLRSAATVLEVLLADGERIMERRDDPLGSPDRRLDRAAVTAKLLEAGDALGWGARTGSIADVVLGLADSPSIMPLMSLLAAPERDPTP